MNPFKSIYQFLTFGYRINADIADAARQRADIDLTAAKAQIAELEKELEVAHAVNLALRNGQKVYRVTGVALPLIFGKGVEPKPFTKIVVTCEDVATVKAQFHSEFGFGVGRVVGNVKVEEISLELNPTNELPPVDISKGIRDEAPHAVMAGG